MSVERFALWTCDDCGWEMRTVTDLKLPDGWAVQYDGSIVKHICDTCQEDEE
jgi:predicted RNA-binding Zn-ribbon protein involved in translation (DUF1610 family)